VTEMGGEAEMGAHLYEFLMKFIVFIYLVAFRRRGSQEPVSFFGGVRGAGSFLPGRGAARNSRLFLPSRPGTTRCKKIRRKHPQRPDALQRLPV
jgi:hypothetical protein